MENNAEEKSIEIYVATHKKVDITFPSHCKLIQVNSALNEKIPGYLYDDAGVNISYKNYCYCELTALYSLWKNSDADIKGLYHYRRFFYNGDPCKYTVRRFVFAKKVEKSCLTEKQIKDYLNDCDAIVEMPYCPYPRTVKEDLLRFCYQKDIDNLTEVIKLNFSEYFDDYNEVMASTHISYCNMIITTDKILDGYCKWLFDVLARCEEACDIDNYDTQHKRIYGYFSEVLMNVYLKRNAFKLKYVPMASVYEYTDDITLKNWKLINKVRFFVFNLLGIKTHKQTAMVFKEYDRYLKSL